MNTPIVQAEPATAQVQASTTNGAPTSRNRVFSAGDLAFMIGVPAAWGILLLFHPIGGDTFYENIEGNVTAWITVHLGMGIFVPLFAAVVLLLLRGLEGTAAKVSRCGLAAFAVLYAMWEVLLGGGTGILTNEVEGLPPAQQAVGVDLVEAYGESGVIMALSALGSVGLAVGLIGAVVALRGAYRLGWAPIVLILLSLPLIALHEPPFGPVGLALFIGAVVLFARQQAAAPARTAPPLAHPVPAPPV
jgi:hypothetical protein